MTPELVASETEDLLASVLENVRDLRKELESLKNKLRSEEDIDAPRASKQVSNAVALLETCQKVENRLVECRSKNIGIAQGGYALDLERARFDIGCQLARLCCANGTG